MKAERVGAVLLAGLLGLAAGCGGSGGGSTSGSASASASTTGEAAPTPSSSPSSTSSPTTGSSSGLTGSDLFPRLVAAQRKAGSYTFTLTTGLGGQSITGKGEADTSTTPPSSHVTIGIGGQQVETITTGGLYYLKGAMLGGSKWLKIDPKAKTGAGAILGQLGSTDPTSTLAALQDAASVTKAGSASVAGTSTTQYDVTVPGSALVKSSAVPAQLQSMLPKTLDYRLFVDAQDQLRRLTSKVTVQGKQVTTQIDFAGYGSKVSISAPPASQVTTTP